ncbi:ABC transporter ATP-binding/permease protein [Mycobacterium attenuatum]|uniref:ABC transporter ATP-binding/permease protein n=2 Tax=Mycobacterium attenuatum TaxID=2341086 RepID=A0A498Q6P2_9MYCO|nr:ABC transporter ATP-binding/permease protein [Mycobacterium attenuatum]VBA56110.1 ABC transporter ATP-binding/permease protein [Mycobacterium attenuatum]
MIPNAPPLTVWFGPMRYVFAPGRDVLVGRGTQCDIRLDRPGPVDRPAPDVVLRFLDSHWVAMDGSGNGIFADGARLSAVDIRDGQTIAIGDPRSGPRLTFQLAALTGPAMAVGPPDHKVPPHPPPTGPAAATGQWRKAAKPTEQATQRIPATSITRPAQPLAHRIVAESATQRIRAASTVDRTTKPIGLTPQGTPPATEAGHPPPVDQHPPPVDRPAPPGDRPAGRGLVERMTGATRKLRAARPDTGPREGSEEEGPTTSRLPLKPGARTLGVAAYRLGLTVDERELLSDISFTARPGSLMAVIGPAESRNTALIQLLAGLRPLGSGVLTVDGHDVQAEPKWGRSRIGVVPREDAVHGCLTVDKALDYAAELRLPPDTTPETRERVVNHVLEELELTPHRKTRVTKLAPDVRRCASMATELVSRPSLLVVDEPSAGLNSAQESHVMAMLRRQADLGCVVVLATTSLAHLNMCDQVLLLTPAGSLAFAGPPVQLEPAMGTTDWSAVFARVGADPGGAHQAFLNQQQAAGSVPQAPPAVAAPGRPPAELNADQQLWLAIRRQARLLFARRLSFLLLVLLPLLLGGLTLLIPGDSGFDRAGRLASNQHEATEILAALNLAAVLMGTMLTVGDLVGERRTLRREQAVGLSTLAYLVAKVIVFGLVAAIQAAVLTAVVVAIKGPPVHEAVLLRNPTVELYVSVAATAVVSMIVGLALSTLGRSKREVLPLAVPVMLGSALFGGGLLPLVGRWGFDQISWLIPAHWGFAAAAATVDLRRVDPLAAHNGVWTHYTGWWAFDMAMLIILGAWWAGFVLFRLRPSPGRGMSTRP